MKKSSGRALKVRGSGPISRISRGRGSPLVGGEFANLKETRESAQVFCIGMAALIGPRGEEEGRALFYEKGAEGLH